jgi:hypothetical protein
MSNSRELSQIAAAVTVDTSKNVSIAEKITVTKDSSISGLTVGKGKGGAGDTNTVVGADIFSNSVSGNRNSAFGRYALGSISSGSDNTGLGFSAGYNTTTGSSNTSVGKDALFSNTTAGNNTAVGYQAGYTNSTGDLGTFIGRYAGFSNTTGTQNTAIGNYSLGNNTTAGFNTAIGSLALLGNTTGANNTALGADSLRNNTTANNNTAVGYQAGYSNTTGRLTALGYQAGYSNTTGDLNTFIGLNTGYSVTTGSNNTFIGSGGVSGVINSAGYAMTTGSKNTIIGNYTGNNGGLDIRTSSNYIVLSDGDGNPRCYWDNNGQMNTRASYTDGYSLVAVNTQATRPYGIWSKFTGATPNNTTQTFLDCEDPTNQKLSIYSSGTVTNRTGTYNTFSDIKLKQDIVDATPQWDDIKAIRFRKYRLIDDVKANANAPYLMGVVAQELQQTSPNLIDECFNREGEITLGVKTSIIYMKAVKALQEAMERIETLEAKVTALENK